MLHTKFRGNRPAGSGEEDFLKVFTMCGHGSHLGHGTSIITSDFHFLVPESFHTKFGSDRQIRFEFLHVRDLEPSSRNDLDLQYSRTFIYSIR